jgi:cardiolipin synthase (CMP-forming)
MAGGRVFTVPNGISVLRLACAPLLCWILFGPDDRTAAFVLLVVLGVTDWVDGWIARHFDQGSELGKVLDPVADRVLLLTVTVALLVEGSVPGWVGALILVREAVVAAATLALAAAGARRINVQWLGKAGTLGLMFALPAFVLAHDLAAGAGRDVVLGIAWLFTAGGLLLGYAALGAYVPVARQALREGRAGRAGRVAA